MMPKKKRSRSPLRRDAFIRLRNRIARLKSGERLTEVYENLLQSMEESLELRKQRLERRRSDLPGYRCYLMNGGHIVAVEVIRCPDDAEAKVRAADLLDAKPEHEDVEIGTDLAWWAVSCGRPRKPPRFRRATEARAVSFQRRANRRA